MSRLEQLIAELCPDGVIFWELGEIGHFYGGLTGKTKLDFQNGDRRFISYMNVYKNPAIDINSSDFVRIDPGERQNTVQYGDVLFTGSSETPEECGISSVMVNMPEENYYMNSFCIGFRLNDTRALDPHFSKHLFRSTELRNQINRTANGVTRFNVSKARLAKVVVPIPPMPVQKEIVRILDTFTTLEAELEKELEACTRQYETYRDALLAFDTESLQSHSLRSTRLNNLIQTLCPDGVKFYKLEEIFNIRNGYTPSKKEPGYWENGTIPWFRMEDIRDRGRILSDSIQHITPIAVKGKLFPSNSVIISTLATIGLHALITRDFIANQQFTCLTRKERFENLLLPEFVSYYCFVLAEWCKRNINVSGFASVDMALLKKFRFPIPPLPVQEEIVAILDRFDALVNDLKNGLPAEIAARRKQYEYYRDQLLTFKPLP